MEYISSRVNWIQRSFPLSFAPLPLEASQVNIQVLKSQKINIQILFWINWISWDFDWNHQCQICSRPILRSAQCSIFNDKLHHSLGLGPAEHWQRYELDDQRLHGSPRRRLSFPFLDYKGRRLRLAVHWFASERRLCSTSSGDLWGSMANRNSSFDAPIE